ncbi:MAG: Rieske (2Fe-2S) protein [Chloroflexota bacterium]|nr:Rieske (2Fe-2S) protein [Chloroflexota bacterium]
MFNLGPIEQIPVGEGREFVVGGRRVAVFRGRDGHLYATRATCPHQGGPLADGIMGGGQIVCPLHGFRFDLADGRALNGACQALQIYPVRPAAGGNAVVALQP